MVDRSDHQPLPYANIGIPDKGTGTVADADGRFTLDYHSSDTIYVSFVGYRLMKFTGEELNTTDTLYLEREIAILDIVEVTAPAGVSLEVLGKCIDKRKQAIGYGSSQLGTAIGAHIEVKEPHLAQSAHFYVQHIDGGRMLYRLQIYDFKNGYVGDPLLLENVIIDDVQKKGLHTVDLSPHHLILEGDVLMTLEWISDDEEKGNNGIMFRSEKSRKPNLYVRFSSQEPYAKMKEKIRVAPRLNIGFYIMGFPMKN